MEQIFAAFYTKNSAPSAGGNNRKVHLIKSVWGDQPATAFCGASIPRRPATKGTTLPECKHCFA